MRMLSDSADSRICDWSKTSLSLMSMSMRHLQAPVAPTTPNIAKLIPGQCKVIGAEKGVPLTPLHLVVEQE